MLQFKLGNCSLGLKFLMLLRLCRNGNKTLESSIPLAATVRELLRHKVHHSIFFIFLHLKNNIIPDLFYMDATKWIKYLYQTQCYMDMGIGYVSDVKLLDIFVID